MGKFYGFSVSQSCALFRTKDLQKSLEIDITNSLSLDFSKFGAGNDLLLFLNTALRYKQVKGTELTTAFFKYHMHSFTIANKLSIYYDFANYYFLNQNLPFFLPKYKAILWLRMKRIKESNLVINLIEERIDIFFLFRFLLKKLLNFRK